MQQVANKVVYIKVDNRMVCILQSPKATKRFCKSYRYTKAR